MITIKDATIKEHDTFRFVTYKFENLSIDITKDNFINFLNGFYKKLTKIDIIARETVIKQELPNKRDIDTQYVIFYGDEIKREGFESIYKAKGVINRKNEFEGECSFFYIFEQTIKENFHIYFNIKNCDIKSDNYLIDEIVIYMAQFFNEDELLYKNLFNTTLNLIENFQKL
jgi:hypothetical protein